MDGTIFDNRLAKLVTHVSMLSSFIKQGVDTSLTSQMQIL